MKRTVSIALALIMMLSCTALFTSCSADDGTSVVSLDINPSVELVVDSDNKVTGVYGSNEDAKILLSTENDIKGKDVEEAVKDITTLAIELNYIGDGNKVIGTTVSSTSDATEKRLEKEIKATVENTAESKGITVSTTDGFFFSVTRKYNDFKKENPDSDITLAEFKLALQAADTGDVTIDVAINMDKDELIDIINKHHTNAEAFVTRSFEQTRAAANFAYEKSVGTITDAIYMKHYAKNMFKHTDSFYYGGLYMMYKTSARGFEAMAQIADTVTRIYDTELGKEQIESIRKILELTDNEMHLIQNADGSVTIRSIEAYVDKLLKNMTDREKAENLSKELALTLSGIELNIKININNELDKECVKCIDIMEESKHVLDKISPLIPESAKPAYEDFVKDYNEIIDKVNELQADDKLSADDFREISALLEEKSSVIEGKIKTDLSEEELNNIKQEQENVKNKLDEYKAQFDSKMEEAETCAKQYLESARQKRLKLVSDAK